MSRTDSDNASTGINSILAIHLEHQFGERFKKVRTLVSSDLILAKVRDLPSPTPQIDGTRNRNPLRFQQYFESRLKESEDVLKDRLSLFLDEPIRKVDYIVDVNGKEMRIAIYVGENKQDRVVELQSHS